ncbi:hypothetical protein PPERSA_10636 [Pseudocohnilembus persalinus]|uniref:EGF-like domain-containing protein n=1 Tax=Pseudocohnilembus persalinus TaxID=266149 RepID=A0A0V0QD34_PSEPJ|nr:hypothetical protein PPERSA_10636 [Pseudocohnilembus persalinus]|eukprot:KRX00137.1 hypothetical protein PPERSA_10636 [Pseudocohnilembus persalinus]
MKAKVTLGLLLLGTIIVLALYSSESTLSSQLFKKHSKQISTLQFEKESQLKSLKSELEKETNFEEIKEKIQFDKESQKLIFLQSEKELKINKHVKIWSDSEIQHMKLGKAQGKETFKHNCVHEQKQEHWKAHQQEQESVFQQEIMIQQQQERKFQHKEASDWQAIRFHVDYSNIMNNGIPEESIDFIKNKMIPAAQAYFESTFLVHRLESPIVPSKYYTSRGYKCNGEVEIPESIYGGVEDADMVMIITAGYDEGENYLAYASKCHQYEREIDSKRPTLGFFRINASFLEKDLNAQRWFTWVETAIHEMMHAMGFSSYQFKNFLNNGGQVGQFNGQNFFMGHNTVAYGKSYFKCNFNGVPLEQNGGSGSAGSHWERTALGNEGMTASDFGDAVFSKFTLNLFRDSGWYEYNESNAQELAWAKGGGCDTMKGLCDKTIPEHTCTVGNQGCSFDYSAAGVCVIQDSFAPDCPFYMGYSNGNCQYGDYMTKIAARVGGAVNYDSRCWDIKSQTAGYSNLADSCFESSCVDGQVSVKVDGKWQTCKQEGDLIYGKNVVLECPEFDTFCIVESNCDNSCTAQGTCINGTCQCYKGYAGDSCQLAADESSTDDAGNGSDVPEDDESTYKYKKYYGTYYCHSNDYLLQNGDQYLCCNDEVNGCCGLYQQVTPGYCYCINGMSFDYYTQRCI